MILVLLRIFSVQIRQPGERAMILLLRFTFVSRQMHEGFQALGTATDKIAGRDAFYSKGKNFSGNIVIKAGKISSDPKTFYIDPDQPVPNNRLAKAPNKTWISLDGRRSWIAILGVDDRANNNPAAECRNRSR